jgi:hypothetical protein
VKTSLIKMGMNQMKDRKSMDRAHEEEMIFNADIAAAIIAVGRDSRLVVMDDMPVADRQRNGRGARP